MKKSLFGLIMLAALVIPFAGAQAAQSDGGNEVYTNPAGNPVDQFTGKYWVNSSLTEKEAYLFGIDSAVAVEQMISERQIADAAKSGKKPGFTLSPFEKGWMNAFRHMTRQQVVKAVDDWYAANPDKLDRPVLDVIWYDVVVPQLDK